MKHWETELFDHGLKDGILVHVTNVENGKKSNCKCPQCNEDLIAVNNIKGKKPRAHFRHFSNGNCNHKHYQETVVHYLAKQIIEELGFINVPKISFIISKNINNLMMDIDTDKLPKFNKLPKYIKKHEETYQLRFDKIIIEKKEKQIRPDIKIFIKGKPLIVEIAYTHCVDDIKLKKIKEDKLDAIEIDLSYLHKNTSETLIRNALSSTNSKATWLNNIKINQLLFNKITKALELRDEIWGNSKGLKTYANMHRIYNCPLKKQNGGKRYVEIEEECKKCYYFVDLMEDTNWDKEEYKHEYITMLENGEDTTYLKEKYGNKIHYKSGQLNCIGHMKKYYDKIIIEENNNQKI